MLNEIGDRADLQPVRVRERNEVRQARHVAVVLEDLADHRRRRAASQARQIASAFGVAGARQHAAVLRHQRKNMPRLHQIVGGGIRPHGRLHSPRAVGRGNTRRNTQGSLDGNCERRTVSRTVVRDHQRQLETSTLRLGQRQADQAASVTGHEVDRLRRHEVRRQHEIAFVLAIFFVDDHDHAARANVFDDLGGRTDAHGLPGVSLRRVSKGS